MLASLLLRVDDKRYRPLDGNLMNKLGQLVVQLWRQPLGAHKMRINQWPLLFGRSWPSRIARGSGPSSCCVCRRVFHFDWTGRAFHENMCPASIATSVQSLLSEKALHRCRPETSNWTLPICRTLLSSPTMKTADSILSLILFHQISTAQSSSSALWRLMVLTGKRNPPGLGSRLQIGIFHEIFIKTLSPAAICALFIHSSSPLERQIQMDRRLILEIPAWRIGLPVSDISQQRQLASNWLFIEYFKSFPSSGRNQVPSKPIFCLLPLLCCRVFITLVFTCSFMAIFTRNWRIHCQRTPFTWRI